jgi:hypothetical protein
MPPLLLLKANKALVSLGELEVEIIHARESLIKGSRISGYAISGRMSSFFHVLPTLWFFCGRGINILNDLAEKGHKAA